MFIIFFFHYLVFIPTDSVVSHISTSNSITSSTTVAVTQSSRTSPIAVRLSPGLISPKHMNGPLMQQQQQPPPQLPQPQQQPPQQPNQQQDASTLKIIAQEAINRSTNTIDSIIPIPSSVSAGVIPRVVQQQPLPTQQQQPPPPPPPHQQSQQHFSSTASSVASASAPPTDSTVTISSSVTTNGPILSTGDQPSLSTSIKQQLPIPTTNEAHIPPLLGVAPLGPQPLQKEQQYQFQMMEASSHHLPQLSDSERLGTYYHRNPVQTPAHYPQVSFVYVDLSTLLPILIRLLPFLSGR